MSFISVAKKLSFAARLGFAIAGLFGKNRKSESGSEYASLELPTTKEGTTIPVVFGTRDIKSPILAWYGNTRKESDLFYLSAIFVLCYGRIKSLSRISYGDKLIWSGSKDGFYYRDGIIRKNSNFSDDSGLYGEFIFDNGENTLPVNSFSSALTGIEMKYSGLSHIILKDICVGPVSSLKNLSFRVVGLGADSDEDEWNYANAEILTPEQIFSYSEIPGDEIDDWNSSLIAVNTDEPYNINVQLDYQFRDTGSAPQGALYDVAFLFTKGLTANEIARKIENEEFDYLSTTTGPVLSGTIEIPGDKCETIGGNGIFRVMRFIRVNAYDPTILTESIVPKIPALIDLNPAHIIYYALRNKRWGAGVGYYDIDQDNFSYAASVLKSEGFGLSIKWDKSGSVYDLIQDVLEHINAVLFVDRKTGAFKLNLIRHDYNTSLLTVLDSENIENVTDYKRTSSNDLYNTVNLSYYDTLLGESAGVSVSDVAMVNEAGRTIATNINFPGISNATVAKNVAMRELKAASTPIDSCTIVANYDAKNLDIGDAFILDYPKYTSAPTVFRVVKISFGDGVSNKITVEASKDVW